MHRSGQRNCKKLAPEWKPVYKQSCVRETEQGVALTLELQVYFTARPSVECMVGSKEPC